MDPVPALDLAVIAGHTRTRILRAIQDEPGGRVLVGELATRLELRQPTVSHHMRALRDAGVVVRRVDGRRAWYSIAPEHADRMATLLAPPPDAAGRVDLDRIAEDLTTRFRGIFAAETVRALVEDSHARLASVEPGGLLGSRTATFAGERLSAAARALIASARPEVLFVCVRNAGRSQIAAAVLRHLAGDDVTVRTAGSHPAPRVGLTIVAALDEIGVSLAGDFPKPLTDDVVRSADVVVTMGCGDACPVYPGRRYLDWDLPDPADLPLAAVRGIRDDIVGRVHGLLADLRSTASVNSS